MEDYSRVTGLVSNLDTKGLVNNMLKIEKVRVDRVKATQTKMKWKQEGYREVATMLKGLESSYFDLVNKKDDLRLASNYSSFETFVNVNGEKSNAVSAVILGNADFEKIEIEEIEQVARPEQYMPEKSLKNISGKLNLDKLNEVLANGGTYKLKFKLDGTKKSIQLADNYADIDSFKADVEAKLSEEFGKHAVKLDFKEIPQEVAPGEEAPKIYDITFKSNNHQLEYNIADTALKESIDIKNGAKNYFDINGTISNIVDLNNGPIKLDVSFLSTNEDAKRTKIPRVKHLVEIKPSDKILDVVKKFNKAQKVAELKYDKITGKFSLKSTRMGADGKMVFNDDDTKDFFKDLGLDEKSKQEYQSSVLKVNGEYVTNDSNKIEIDGATITINKVHKESHSIEITKKFNTNGVKEKVRGFIKKYNEVIEKLNTMVKEKKNYKYQPLTEEEKKDLKKEEIEKWEEKAKAGLFRGDNGIRKILSDLRGAFNDKVEGTDLTMAKLGLYFTKDYRDGGKLELDDEKFDKAFKEDRESAIKLLTSRSKVRFGNRKGVAKRYQQNGVMQRIQDIIKSNTSTVKTDTGEFDDRGNKIYGPRGYLVEKAGIKGTATEYLSELSLKIAKINKRIDSMMDVLYEKEDKYYMDFARLETSLSQISAQSNAFAGLMGGGMM